MAVSPIARSIDLCGEWSIREALGDTWQWYVRKSPTQTGINVAGNNVADAAAAATRSPGWIAARVPGSVIADLHSAGELPDPYAARNSKAAEWVAERHWVYSRSVDLPQVTPGERVLLEFDGIDPGGRVYWDGVEVGRASGIFHSTTIELSGLPLVGPELSGPELSDPELSDPGLSDPGLTDIGLTDIERRPAEPDSRAGTQPAMPDTSAGTHSLAVVVEPAPQSEPQVGETGRVRVHTPRMNYGWDFSPRLLHQGIWKAARIRIGRSLVTSATARTELDENLRTGRVIVTVVVDGPVLVECLGQSAELAGSGTVTIHVRDPELWHPAGRGPQALHPVRVSTADDARDLSVGFRHLQFTDNPGAPTGALPYTAVVNGEPLPLVGWNWAPADTLYGTIDRERIEHLVDLARRSGARLLRVWGGGLIETEEFYDVCDRAGLLVWQEFSQSSSGMQSAPATDASFVLHMREEAESIVPTRTRHPSLAMWGGGNELEDDGGPLDEGRSPVLLALRGAVEELDPGRHWVATSPTGPVFHNRLDVIEADPDSQHDVHGPWEHQGLVAHHELYNAGTSLAHTEFGVEGMTNLRSLEALIPAADRWPADRSNPVYRHLGEWWNNAPLVNDAFGGRLDSVERMQRASQFLQASGLAYAVEADRRRSPRCSMVLPWQLAESYPNAWCTSVVDYRGDAKAAYYSVARAFLPDRVTLRTSRSAWGGSRKVDAEAWVWSEAGVAVGSTVLVRLLDVAGSVLAEKSLPAPAVSHPVPVGSLVAANPGGLFAWEVSWTSADGALLDRDVVLATGREHFGPLLDLDGATVAADLLVDPWGAANSGSGGAADVHNSSNVPDRLEHRPGNTGLRDGGSGNWRSYEQDATLLVTHVGGPMIPGLRLLDARPAGANGWAVLDGDPRPLLPGETREFGIRWRDAEPGPLTLDAWNLEPMELN